MYWRTLPVLIAAVVWPTLSEGDLVVQKIPYNKNKSKARSIAMASAGFLAYIGDYLCKTRNNNLLAGQRCRVAVSLI
ncbi:probable phytol kinase 3, chloroplastic isoform X2 [Vicia villosa]|uniref:probable phytol kinase 3, chloroplastic isoform X2 n=1 Tax=Vicia villosa TaxID=3911 RepID=UPI00273C2314|nr:probable phytol kinase 3, chloroplastic isoform X2 [Vicia villosa]